MLSDSVEPFDKLTVKHVVMDSVELFDKLTIEHVVMDLVELEHLVILTIEHVVMDSVALKLNLQRLTSFHFMKKSSPLLGELKSTFL